MIFQKQMNGLFYSHQKSIGHNNMNLSKKVMWIFLFIWVFKYSLWAFKNIIYILLSFLRVYFHKDLMNSGDKCKPKRLNKMNWPPHKAIRIVEPTI